MKFAPTFTHTRTPARGVRTAPRRRLPLFRALRPRGRTVIGSGAAALLAALVTGTPARAQVAPGDTTAARVDTTAARADTARLRPVVVTATRLPLRQTVPTASTTIISGEALRARGTLFVLDALRQVPGVVVAQTGSFGTTASLFLRGGESDYVRVLVDGVAVNDAGGAYDWSGLLAENVDRIEIVRGPASVLYGSDAVAGVIQIFTRAGEGSPRLSLAARGGSYGTTEGRLSLLGGSPAARYSVAATRLATSGTLPFNSGYTSTALSGQLRLAPARGTNVRIAARWRDGTVHYPTGSAGQLEDSNAYRPQRVLTASIDAGRFFTPRLEARLLVGGSRATSGTVDRPDGPADTVGVYTYLSDGTAERGSIDARGNLYLTPRTVLTAGAELEGERERSTTYYESSYGPPSNDDFRAQRTNRGYYAQLAGNMGSALSFTAGGRVDDNDRFGTFGTYRVAAGARLGNSVRVRAALGTAFKEPSFYETFATGFVTGNPALRPERTRSWEVGLSRDLASGRATASATWFAQRFRDLIQYTSLPPREGAPNYFNVAAANADGAELELVLRSAVDLRASYTYLRTRVTDAGFDSTASANFVRGSRLLRRPTHLAQLRVARRLAGRGNVSLDVAYVGAREDRDFGSYPARPVVLAPYATVGAGAELAIMRDARRPDLALTLSAENLLGARYQTVVGFPAPGRTLLAGVRLGLGT